jgi:hypothetical protein
MRPGFTACSQGVSATFAAACGNQRARPVCVGHYALRGVGRPQELFTSISAKPKRLG